MEVCTLGGYSEVGKNMTAVKVNGDVIILDMGFYIPKLIDFEEGGGERRTVSRDDLIRIGAIANDNIISNWRDKVKAIAVSHCHLDHLGGVLYLASNYNAPVLGTPYTIEVLKSMLKEENISIKNQVKTINPNSSFNLKNMDIEFINMTHSTLQTAMIAVHTEEGTILYANDFKFDRHPVVGKEPNFKRLKQLGRENVIALVVDSLYAYNEQKTPSEKVAREMLKDVMLGTENEDNAIIVTTFASHIARLKSIFDFGKKLDRKVVFLGRSMKKYIEAAENINLIKFPRADILSYRSKIQKKLKEIEKQGRDKYLIICTGGQGEPSSVLTRMATNQLPFEFLAGDHAIFSNKTIPVEINMANRARLEGRLRNKKVRLFTDIHVSGHAFKEDLRDLINMVKPQHIIPAHGDLGMLTALGGLASEMGYELGKNVHLMSDGQKLTIQ